MVAATLHEAVLEPQRARQKWRPNWPVIGSLLLCAGFWFGVGCAIGRVLG